MSNRRSDRLSRQRCHIYFFKYIYYFRQGFQMSTFVVPVFPICYSQKAMMFIKQMEGRVHFNKIYYCKKIVFHPILKKRKHSAHHANINFNNWFFNGTFELWRVLSQQHVYELLFYKMFVNKTKIIKRCHPSTFYDRFSVSTT